MMSMDRPITDAESTREEPLSFDEPEQPSAYIVGIEDLFRVDACEVASPEEAKNLVLRRLGEEPYEAYDATIVDVEP